MFIFFNLIKYITRFLYFIVFYPIHLVSHKHVMLTFLLIMVLVTSITLTVNTLIFYVINLSLSSCTCFFIHVLSDARTRTFSNTFRRLKYNTPCPSSKHCGPDTANCSSKMPWYLLICS